MRISLEQFKRQASKAGKKLGLVGTALTAFVNQAMAAVPAEVTTAMGDMKTDTLAVATAFLVLAITVAAFMWMKRPAK